VRPFSPGAVGLLLRLSAAPIVGQSRGRGVSDVQTFRLELNLADHESTMARKIR
jgi:hypothetical protein